MAKVELLAPFIKKWEGGFVNDPIDLGGATNKGVTIGTYTAYRKAKGMNPPTVADLKALTDAEWTDILKTMFWDKWSADEIKNQSVANILVDWVWASGKYGINLPQKILGVNIDGIVGKITLAAVNGYSSQQELFNKIVDERKAYIERIIVGRPANAKYRKGWLNRINDFKYSD